MVDIQSATAEIRRGKKKKKQDKNIMSASSRQGGHKKASRGKENRSNGYDMLGKSCRPTKHTHCKMKQ